MQERGRRGIADTPTKNELLWRKITDTMICVGGRKHEPSPRTTRWIGRLAYKAFDWTAPSVAACLEKPTERQPSSLFERAGLLVEASGNPKASKSKAQSIPLRVEGVTPPPPGFDRVCLLRRRTKRRRRLACLGRPTWNVERVPRWGACHRSPMSRRAASQQAAGLSANWCDRSSMTMLIRLRLIVWCRRFGSDYNGGR